MPSSVGLSAPSAGLSPSGLEGASPLPGPPAESATVIVISFPLTFVICPMMPSDFSSASFSLLSVPVSLLTVPLSLLPVSCDTEASDDTSSLTTDDPATPVPDAAEVLLPHAVISTDAAIITAAIVPVLFLSVISYLLSPHTVLKMFPAF